MPSWETYNTNLDEQSQRDFVLKQPSTVGPWVTPRVGYHIARVSGSLVYMNLLLPPSASVSPERALRPEAGLALPGAHPKRTSQRFLGRHKPAITIVPQGRAPHALLGGLGPALPPEYGVQAGTPLMPRIPPRPRLDASKGQQAHCAQALTTTSSYGDGPPASLPALFLGNFASGQGERLGTQGLPQRQAIFELIFT